MMTKETTTNLEKQLKGIHLSLGDTMYSDFAGDLSVCYECTLKDPKAFLGLLPPQELKDLQAATDKQDWVEEFVTENMFDTQLTVDSDYPSVDTFGLVLDEWNKD